VHDWAEADASHVVNLLELSRHPEGGWFRETWRAPAAAGERAAGTAIYYLLPHGERSRWHRIDAAEAWHYYAGAPMHLDVSVDGITVEQVVLVTSLATGERPQHVVAAGAWQSARSLGRWSLVGCTVSPAFELAGFELAAEGWEPSG
jgi:predicted cupin superfamily sugar epimerase